MKPNAEASQDEAKLHDPIEMEVFMNRLLSITEDMNNTLVRASFSTNIKERKDCSVALFDVRGRLVAQGTQIPLHLGSLNGAVEAVLARFPASSIQPGDVFVCNDPYLSKGSHLPDINIVTPVFHDGVPVFFAANIAHHSDVGGRVPGSISGDARTVFEEGIRIPALRIARAGPIDDEVLSLICSNTRDPDERNLDLRVQIASNQRGVDAVEALIAQMGLSRVLQAVDDVIRYTRLRLENRIAQLAQGSYTFTNWLDDDGLGGEPVEIRVAVTVSGRRLHFNFAGSGREARGAMNLPTSALNACVYYAVKALLDPELPANAGLFEPIDIEAPRGTIVNPEPPAAVGARSITAQKVAGAIFGAFRGVLPAGRVMAASNDVCPVIVFSGRLNTRPGEFVYLESIGGGSGARLDVDGMDGVHVHMTNSSNLPVEAMENEYPLLVDEYALIADSGGAGRTRGGLGIARQITALDDGLMFSARSDSHRVGLPEGVAGGRPGRRARLLKRAADGSETVLDSKPAAMRLVAGESIRIETCGGGGYGAPEGRRPDDLERDVLDGKVSRAAMLAEYGAADPILTLA
jgi:N-methylhydantoinase B